MKLRIKSEYFIDKTSKSFKIEEYLMIFEILISSNNSEKLSDILRLLHKIVEKEYINKEIFNYFLESGIYQEYAEKYLKLEQIDVNDVVLFMKGTAEMPVCGFSKVIVQILKMLKVEFKAINVLDDMSIREGIKQFSNWPTIPQLYIKKEFIGGCDIVTEMYKSGELQEYLGKMKISFEDAK